MRSGPGCWHLLKNRDDLPGNIGFSGYALSPSEALARADIVLNLSNFEETFGRTVLEAMAAGRPVVAYDWGALPELIDHGETGFLVPYKDIQAAAERIRFLCDNLVTGACFAEMGSRVTCMDIDVKKIENLKQGILPIYEPGLEKLVQENMADGTLEFTTRLEEAARDCQVFFIAGGLILNLMWCPIRNFSRKGRPSRIFSNRTGSLWGSTRTGPPKLMENLPAPGFQTDERTDEREPAF